MIPNPNQRQTRQMDSGPPGTFYTEKEQSTNAEPSATRLGRPRGRERERERRGKTKRVREKEWNTVGNEPHNLEKLKPR